MRTLPVRKMVQKRNALRGKAAFSVRVMTDLVLKEAARIFRFFAESANAWFVTHGRYLIKPDTRVNPLNCDVNPIFQIVGRAIRP